MGRVVYVLATDGCDYYSATTQISVESVRISNPSLRVVVVADAPSGRALKNSCRPLLNEIDELVICDTPEGNKEYCSRHLKTRLRNIIEGPFLFLDSDTLVRGDLSTIFSLDTDIAAASNGSRDEFREQIFEADDRIIALMKWPLSKRIFLNSGVLFYNDTANAKRFASLWHQKWLEAAGEQRKYRDQPALHAALFDAQPRLSILPHRFNAQFKATPRVAEDAIIWHFCGSHEVSTYFNSLVERILRGEKLCRNTVVEMIQRPHPWRGDSWLDDRIATGLVARKLHEVRTRSGGHGPDVGFNAWFQGHRLLACRYWTIQALEHLSPRTLSVARGAKSRIRETLRSNI